ncbi:hypothetical protein HYT33_01870 [Candidatus Roizmanbacteria bacterium]|nr:hypothetical protein [Candidatus Roizmanbacteria bacterium]
MWERLGYRGIDASVVSRVLNGVRLFTPRQLEVFCEVLALPEREKEKLEYALYLDQVKKYGVSLPLSSQINYDILDLFDSLLDKALDYRLKGKNDDQESIANITHTYIQKSLHIVKKASLRKKLLEQLGTVLFLKGNALGATGLPNVIVDEAVKIVSQLITIAKQNKNPVYEAYGNIILAGAYYVAGNYSYSFRAKSLYGRSINQAQRAFQLLPDSNHEKLFALRNIIACMIYLRDKQDFINLKKTALNQLPQTNPTHFLNGLNLFNIISEGVAIFHLSDPLKIKELASKHFNAGLEGRRIHEVSEVRSDLEMSIAIKTKDKSYLTTKVERALQIAKEENYVRHYKHINKLASQFF